MGRRRWGFPLYTSTSEGVLAGAAFLTLGILILWWAVDLARGKSQPT